MVVRSVLIAVPWLTVVLSGCETTQAQTARAADRLEHRADAFAVRTCHEPNATCPSSQQLPAARSFSDQAREFREMLHNAGDQDVVFAFQSLWRSHRALRDEVRDLPDRQIQDEFKRVTQAFVDVQLRVRNGYSHADPTVYASGGYLLDPYYN